MSEFTKDQLDFKDKDVRKAFIHNSESDMYGGKNTDGQDVKE